MDDLTPPHWGAPDQHVIEPCPNPWCHSHKTTDAEIRSFEAPIVEPSRSSFEKRVSCPCCPMSGPWANTETEAIAAWNHRPLVQQAIAAERGEVENARDILSGLSSYLGAGLGDDATTLKQFDERIRWGIDHIGSVYRNRAAQVVEECSKRPQTTWGEVKRAIMDDTTLPTAASTDHEATIAQLRDRVAGLEGGLRAAIEYMAARRTECSEPYPLARCEALLSQNEVG